MSVQFKDEIIAFRDDDQVATEVTTFENLFVLLKPTDLRTIK